MLKIQKGFFNTLKNDLDLSKIAMQKVAGFLDEFQRTRAYEKYSLSEGPLISRVKTHQ